MPPAVAGYYAVLVVLLFLFSCMLLTFEVFLIFFLSFPETNLGSVETEEASVKDQGKLLTTCAYEALTL